MEGSIILGWIGLGSAALAAASMLRSRVQPTEANPRSQGAMALVTTIWLSISLRPVQDAFSVRGDVLHWSLDALQLALLVYLIIQLRRAWRVKPADSKTAV